MERDNQAQIEAKFECLAYDTEANDISAFEELQTEVLERFIEMGRVKPPGKIKRVDVRGRINIGKARANKHYALTHIDDGTLLLSLIPDRELWLWKNKEALASVRQGLEESARGETVDLGDFTQYADDDIDD